MRRRFTKAERETFIAGARVEWRNGRHWHAGTITQAPRLDDITGWDHVAVRNESRKGDAPFGEVVWMSPTSVRIPAQV